MNQAERVNEAGVKQLVELAALFVREARITAIRSGVLQVNLIVSNVEVAAHDHGLCGSCMAFIGHNSLF